MATQVQNGKAFEYALINEANTILSGRGFAVNLIIDATYNNTLACYNLFNARKQLRYSQAAIKAINHIIALEPRLVTSTSAADSITLQLQPDAAGRTGDVRDLLFIRSAQGWEIGISAKNNHMALKHSRLSGIKDFGASWVGVPCSATYWATINPIFAQLVALRVNGVEWKHVPNVHGNFYQPMLNAFSAELSLINNNNTGIPQALISYLVGRNDFYKVIKKAKEVEVLAFNINGTLGRPIGGVSAVTTIRKLALPNQIISFQIAAGLAGTLNMFCNQGWQLSFRLHTAKTLVEASLKFDVNLIGNPATMYSHHIPY